MKYYNYISILISLIFFSCKQNNNNTSLKSAELDSLRALSNKYLNENNSIKFISNNFSYLSLAKINKDSFYIGDAYWVYALFYNKNNQLDSTIKYYNKSIKIYSSIDNDKKVSQLLYNLASLQWINMDYSGAESNIFKSLNLINDYPKQEILNYNLLGIIYLKTNDFKLSIEYFERALSLIAKHRQLESLYHTILNNLGFLYKEIKNYPQSIKYYKDSEKFLKKDDLEKYARQVNNINYVRFLNSGPSKEIEENLKSALIIRLENKYMTGVSDSYLNLSKYYLTLKNDSLALEYANKGLLLSKEIKYHENQLEFYILLSKLKPLNIYNYLLKSNALRDSVDKSERQLRDKLSRIKYETDQYKISANKLETSNSYLKIIIVLVFVVFILITLFIFQINKNKQILLKREIEKEKNQLYKLNEKIFESSIKAKNEERTRIAMDLHDGVLSSLSSIRISLGLNTKESPIQYNNELKKVEQSIREISHNLSDINLLKDSKFKNLLLNSFESTNEIKVSIEDNDVIFWDEVSDTIKTNIFRVIQECYQNTRIHSKASRFIITFEIQENILKIKIMDNGIGFNAKSKHKGIGLSNIKRRIQKVLRGKIEITSNNKGTSVLITISPIYNE